MATPRETAFDKTVVPGAQRAVSYLDTRSSHIAPKVWSTTVNRGGQKVSALQELADTKTIGQKNADALAKLDAKINGLVGAINALSTGEKFDEAKLLASIEEAAQRGVAAAIDSVTREEVTVVTMKEEGLEDLGEIEGAAQ